MDVSIQQSHQYVGGHPWIIRWFMKTGLDRPFDRSIGCFTNISFGMNNCSTILLSTILLFSVDTARILNILDGFLPALLQQSP